MRVRSSILIAAAAAITVSSAPLAAQGLTTGEGPLRSQGALTIGPVASINFPTGDTGDFFETGFTLGVQGTYGLGAIALLGEVTYNSLGGKTVDGIEGFDSGDANGFAIDAGARTGLPIGQKLGLYVGGVTGFWFGDFDDDFDIVPLVGIQLGPVDIEGRYKGLIGDADWFSVGGAVHFRLK